MMMKIILALALNSALAQAQTKPLFFDGASTPHYGCTAKSRFSKDVFYRTAANLVESKNLARNACGYYYEGCEVTQCVEVYDYKITCITARRGYTETVKGAFRVESNDYDFAAERSLRQCEAKHGRGPCVWICYPNNTFIPIKLDEG